MSIKSPGELFNWLLRNTPLLPSKTLYEDTDMHKLIDFEENSFLAGENINHSDLCYVNSDGFLNRITTERLASKLGYIWLATENAEKGSKVVCLTVNRNNI